MDQKEITAALRQCNYDPEEVVSVYLTMFGEILLQASASGDHSSTNLNTFRSVGNWISCTKFLWSFIRQKVYVNMKLTKHLTLTLQSSPGEGPGHRGSEAEAPVQGEGGGQSPPEEHLPGEGGPLPQ